MSARVEKTDGAFSDVDLTIRDRINYPYVLGNQLLTIQRTLMRPRAAREILDAIEALICQIPDDNKDPTFLKELLAAVNVVHRDVRPFVVPGVKFSEKYCEARGIPVSKEIRVRDPWKSLQACFNLMNRLHMLSRKTYQEVRPGDKWDEEWAELEREWIRKFGSDEEKDRLEKVEALEKQSEE